MSNREEKLKAGMEMLRKFREAKQANQVINNVEVDEDKVEEGGLNGSARDEAQSDLQFYFGGESQPFVISSNSPIEGESLPNEEVSSIQHEETIKTEPQNEESFQATHEEDSIGLQEHLSTLRTKSHEYESQILLQTQQIQALQVALEKEQEEKRNLDQRQEQFGNLKMELEGYRASIQMMMSEKAELEKKIKDLSEDMKEKDENISKLNLKLKSVEDTSSKFAEATEKSEKIAKLEQEAIESRISIDDKSHEISELKQKLALKETENTTLSQDLQMVTSKLEMSDVLVTQLRSSSTSNDFEVQLITKDEELKKLADQNSELKKRESELTQYIQQAAQDREQIIHQYTSYSKQLTSQIESLMQQLSGKQEENKNLTTRETQLVSHVERLESQLQTFIQSNKSQENSPENRDVEKEVEDLRKQNNIIESKLSEVERENQEIFEKCQNQEKLLEQLKLNYLEKESLVSELETQVEMLKTSSSTSEVNQELYAAYESDKVAASRAMAQNAQLKEELEELQTAIVNLTNNKADLMNELESQRRHRESSSEQETSMKMEIEALQDGVKERDRIIQQLKDQMKYYVAFAENSINTQSASEAEEEIHERDSEITKLQSELYEAREEVRVLNSHNSELRSQIEVLASNVSSREETSNRDEASNVTGTPNILESSTTSSRTSSRLSNHPLSPTNQDSVPIQVGSYPVDNGFPPQEIVPEKEKSTLNQSNIPVLNQSVAFMKLEQKFNEAMNRIADLLNENEQLEHLTIQLQEETETVGEYITMYQYQRQQIKKRMEEKENQFQIVSREREELKSKLEELQGLLKRHLTTVPANATTNGGEVGTEKFDKKSDSIGKISEALSSQVENNSDSSSDTQRILSLLTEIESNQMLHEEFHPWFWEHNVGKLMTV